MMPIERAAAATRTRGLNMQTVVSTDNAALAEMGYDETELYDVAWPHMADVVADLLDGGGQDGGPDDV